MDEIGVVVGRRSHIIPVRNMKLTKFRYNLCLRSIIYFGKYEKRIKKPEA